MARLCKTCGDDPCSCGIIKSLQQKSGRNWAICDWQYEHGTCQAPTGTISTDPGGVLTPPRLCAFHRDRERVTLSDLRLSEQEFFEDWQRQFEPGTFYQPFPGIWDKPTATLWLLISGHVTWSAVEGSLLGRIPTEARA